MSFCSAKAKGGNEPAFTSWKWATIVLAYTSFPLGLLFMVFLTTAVLPQPASWVPHSGISKSLQLSRDHETKRYITPASWRSDDHPPHEGIKKANIASAKERVLVLYAYANTDPAYSENLRFFVREGLHADNGCRYVIIIQEGNGADKEAEALPRLPGNAQYVRHANECYDWGSYGWYLKLIDTSVYDFFVFMYVFACWPSLLAGFPAQCRWDEFVRTFQRHSSYLA